MITLTITAILNLVTLTATPNVTDAVLNDAYSKIEAACMPLDATELNATIDCDQYID